MTRHVALLRAVNVGGTGALPMETLVRACTEAGFADVRTYIASGNAIFTSGAGEAAIREALEARLAAHTGAAVAVLVRSAAELRAVVAANPFADAPGNQVVALLTDDPVPANPAHGAINMTDERMAAGPRALYIHYPSGQARSRLRLPAMTRGTVRNMNTIARLAAMAES